ncbi:SpoIID/LytB domain-containing protein [Paenibacillus sp. 1011MAR3C5]|uniref:SpoIID/LytB domain-containing protein n=1 Tax=Paenibacillus sp. 1011MAR3C5 TaxID=1675787 RepID=UPI000E6C0292|nr:SpoIID/LytB domain-containing protein [Paenibacillus sp. 1011MAR3C5]RJE91025.1 SpoIID/LytB domain-containing protein [Paenibacillus sp. 1011MAR3C5]
MTFKASWKRLSLATVALLVLVSTLSVQPTRAAVPALDTIRVAMFLQLPGKYESMTAAATFQSAGGIRIGSREPTGFQEWFAVEAGRSVRFAVDDYKVKLIETANFANAWAVYLHIQSVRGMGYITSVPKNGGTQYQVYEGTYASAQESAAALGRWNADAKLRGLLGGYKPVQHGPLRLESPALESKAAAQSLAASFGGAGLDAYVAARAGAKGAVYSVLVGGASTADELKSLQAEAVKAPSGASLKPMDTSSPYMLIRADHSISGKPDSALELYAFPASDMKVWAAPAGAQPIGLTERSNRTYRGSFELSAFNGKLAVINELPFEQYLYSVVAAEMYTSWPIEALKAQAVAARSYALNKGFGFQIAHVVDTTQSQAYYGTGVEKPSSTEAVEATKGEVALYNGKVIEAVFSSNGGGMTADARDVWKNEIPYLQSVSSPDASAEAGLQSWHRVVLPSGKVGYIREDLVKDTGQKTAAGSRILELTTDGTNIRRHPVIQDSIPVVAQLQSGAKVIELEQVLQSNSMNWIRGPFTGEELLTVINSRMNPKLTGSVTSVEVSARGVSGRAIEMTVNGTPIALSSPDSIRSAFGVGESLPSTLFNVEETGKVVIQGAGGAQSTKSDSSKQVYVMGADGKSTSYSQDYMYVLDGDGDIRAATKNPAFSFNGTGFGHGVGMSQYGALSLAQQGYDYQYILKYYYKGITIAKE